MKKKSSLFIILFVAYAYGVFAGSFVITNGLTHEYHVKGGAVYRGSINLENLTLKEKSVKLYIQDYRFFATGEVFYEEPTLKRNPRSNADWIKFSTNFMTLKPEGKHKVEYEIYVPDNVVEDGTFWSIVMVEGIDPVEFEENKKQQVQIRSLVRYGIQIVTHVGDRGKKDIAFERFNISYDKDKKPAFSFDILNTGTLLLKPELKVELFNEKGESCNLFQAPGSRIYPQTSTRNTIPLKNVKPGTYKALVLVDTQNDDIFATEIRMEIKSD